MHLQGQKPELVLSDLSAAFTKISKDFPATKINPPELFNEEVYTSKPIALRKNFFGSRFRNFLTKDLVDSWNGASSSSPSFFAGINVCGQWSYTSKGYKLLRDRKKVYYDAR